MEIERFGIEIYRLGMSIKRFLPLLRWLRYDRKDSKEERKAIDKLAPIRDFLDHEQLKMDTVYLNI